VDTFEYDVPGLIRIPIISELYSPCYPNDIDYDGFVVSLMIAGATVNPFVGGTRKIRVTLGGVPRMTGSSCSVSMVSTLVGTPIVDTCGLNGLELSDAEYLWSVVSPELTGPGSPSPVKTTLSYDPNSSTYMESLIHTVAGDYFITNFMYLRGGLEGRYYLNSDFTDLILPTGLPDLMTRIDNLLEFDFGTSMKVEGIVANSVEWSGYIDPPLVGVESYTFVLKASGGVSMSVGDSGDQVYQLHATYIDTTFTVIMRRGDPMPILIKFIPKSSATFSLRWIYPPGSSSGSVLINPRQLLSVRQMGPPISATWIPGLMSAMSTVVTPLELVMDQSSIIFVEPRDVYGNSAQSTATCLTPGGVFPSCLFNIYTIQDGGIDVAATTTALTGGRFQITVTATTYHTVDLAIELVTTDGNMPLVGSPFRFRVT
jgi:hypothetical protein